MLGTKRKKQFSYPPHKKGRYNQYGKGYNPKVVEQRAPPANGEKKFHEHGVGYTTLTDVATTTIPAYAQESSMCLIPQGDLMHQRNGSKIMITKLTLRWGLMIDTNTNGVLANLVQSSSTWRVILYIDTQCNGAAAPITEYFDTTNANEHPFDVYNNLYNTGRFKCLMDKFINFEAVAPTYNSDAKTFTQCGTMKEFKKTFTLNLPVTFTGTTGTIDTIKTNNIGMFFICNGFGGSDTVTQRKVSFRYRLRFTDY